MRFYIRKRYAVSHLNIRCYLLVRLKIGDAIPVPQWNQGKYFLDEILSVPQSVLFVKEQKASDCRRICSIKEKFARDQGCQGKEDERNQFEAMFHALLMLCT